MIVVVLSRFSAGGDLEGWIMTKLVVIVGIFIAGGDPEDSACEQFGLRMGGVKGVARIEDRRINAPNQIEPSIDFAEQYQSAVTGQCSAPKIDLDGLSAKAFQRGSTLFTLCHCEALGLCGI